MLAPTRALISSEASIMRDLVAAFSSAVKAAVTANKLAAYVAYRRTIPPRPCACWAKSLPLAPVPPSRIPRVTP